MIRGTLSLVWLAIRYRRLQALVLLVLAALITACAVLAPLYDRAMQQALTRLTVDSASASATAIRLESVPPAPGPGGVVPELPTNDELAGLLPASARGWFSPRVDGTSVVAVRSDLTARSPTGPIETRTGACEHLRWLSGGCPARAGDVAVSAADEKNVGLRVGSSFEVVELLPGNRADEPPTALLRVTGVYEQVPGPYWTDRVLTGVSGIVDPRPPYRPGHDVWLSAPETFSGPGATAWLNPTTSVTYPLARAAVGVDEVLAAGPVVTEMAARGRPVIDDVGTDLSDPNQIKASVLSDLPRISETVEEGRRQARITVPVLVIQLGLLALFVLGLTLAAAVEQRRPEVAIARLRGARKQEARRMVLAELLPVVLAGTPLGVAVALAASTVARRTTLQGAASFELGPGFWLGIGCAVLLLAVVTWAAVAAGTRDRIPSLLRRVPTRSRGWRFGAGESVLLAAAGTAVVAFATGGLEGPLALAAPALLALVVGLLVAHLIVPVATWLAGRLTVRGAYAAGLALLGVARRPVTRRVFTVVTVAAALLVFAAYAVTVGGRNRQLAAERDNGAPMVATVVGVDVARALDAVRRTGDGHATPVVRIRAAGGGRTTLAVDPEPFSRVALFPGAYAAGTPWSALRVPTGRPIALTGRALSMRVSTTSLSVSTGASVPLQLQVLDATGTERTVPLGELPEEGARTFVADLPCAAGCTVLGFGISSGYGITFSGRILVDRVRVTGGTTDLPGTADDWRTVITSGDNKLTADPAPAGALGIRLESDGNATPGLVSAYFPPAVPAVVAGGAAGLPVGGVVLGDGLNGQGRTLTGVGTLPRAPSVANYATIVDLDLLRHWGSRIGRTGAIEVWFDSEDPAALDRVRTVLREQGLDVGTVRRLSDARAGYDASVPAWSLQLGVLAAVAGLLLAALVLVLLVASTGRVRSRDLACLGLSGVPRPALGRIAVGEQLPIVLLAVLAGAGCGLAGAALALPTVPLFARAQPAGVLNLSAPWGTVLAALAVALVGLGLVAWFCGRRVVGRARLARVREAL